MERGEPGAATAKFTVASKKGPHFADPLERLGRSADAEAQPRQALAKFEEADKYAPNWGRLNLKWGEALAALGRKDEKAKAQFARAAQLSLTAGEKAELPRDGGPRTL